MDPETKLTRARTQLLLSRPFWAHLALSLEIQQAQVGTMATDGYHLFYDPDQVAAWSVEEVTGVICHEISHCALQHLWRRGGRDPGKWNLACDFASNNMVLADGLKLPKGAQIGFDGQSAEAIYSQLQSSHLDAASPIDNHALWGQGRTAPGTTVVERDEEARWRQLVAQAANGARMQGKLPGHMDTLIADYLHPTLDWTTLLREFLTSSARNDYSLRPNRKHLWVPLYLPSLSGNRLEIGVALDTSGSIPDNLLRRFISEVRGISEQFTAWKVHLFLCDAQVHLYRCISSEEGEWPKTFPGRGGTDFRPVFEDVVARGLDRELGCLVFFTDLEGTFPVAPPPYRVVWVTPPVQDMLVPWGDTITLVDERGAESDLMARVV